MSTTITDEEYIKAWYELAKPICEAAHLEVVGFDPGILFCTKEKYPRSVDLPEWFIERINAALARKKEGG